MGNMLGEADGYIKVIDIPYVQINDKSVKKFFDLLSHHVPSFSQTPVSIDNLDEKI
jgi:hypothetical protein